MRFAVKVLIEDWLKWEAEEAPKQVKVMKGGE
jgi:hypothetical protein